MTSTKTYYPAGGAMRVDGTRYYVLKDHLGSASVVTNQSATTVGEDRFYPFGETRFTTGSMQTDKLFTGQRAMAGLGIYDYGARFYSPKLGRFLSADSIVPGYTDPQNLNRFSYVKNNPLRYIDPTGHKCVSTGPGDCLNDNLKPINGAGGLTLPKKKPGNNNNNGGGEGGGASNPQDMQTSQQGVNFIIYWEVGQGGQPAQRPYNDLGGNCTIGYGHVLLYDKCTGDIKKPYKDNPLSTQGAQDLLKSDLVIYENVVKKTITTDLTQAQFDALVSYVFNAGKDKLNEKGIPELINSGNYQGAAAAIESGPNTTKDVNTGADIYSSALDDRRHAEANLFLNGIYVP